MNWRKRYNDLMKMGPSDATWAARVAEAEKEIEFQNKMYNATSFDELEPSDKDWDRPRRMVVQRGYLVVCSRAILSAEARIAQLEDRLEWAQSDVKALREMLIAERGRLF